MTGQVHFHTRTISIDQPWIVTGADGQAAGGILVGQFMSELVFPGALVGGAIDTRETKHFIPIGPLELVPPASTLDKLNAYTCRMEGIAWHQGLALLTPEQRASELLFAIQDFFGEVILAELKDEWLASIAGVHAKTIALARPRESDSDMFALPRAFTLPKLQIDSHLPTFSKSPDIPDSPVEKLQIWIRDLDRLAHHVLAWLLSCLIILAEWGEERWAALKPWFSPIRTLKQVLALHQRQLNQTLIGVIVIVAILTSAAVSSAATYSWVKLFDSKQTAVSIEDPVPSPNFSQQWWKQYSTALESAKAVSFSLPSFGQSLSVDPRSTANSVNSVESSPNQLAQTPFPIPTPISPELQDQVMAITSKAESESSSPSEAIVAQSVSTDQPLSQLSPTQLNLRLQAAIDNEDWRDALQVVDQMMTIYPTHRDQLGAYRQQLEAQLTGINTYGSPSSGGLLQDLNQAIETQAWDQAIEVVDQMIAVAPHWAIELNLYRQRLQALAITTSPTAYSIQSTQAEQLGLELDRAVTAKKWDRAIQIVDQMTETFPEQRDQLISYRQRIEGLRIMG